MSKTLFKPGMKEQIGQKKYILQEDEITTMSSCVHAIPHIFFKKKSTKDNEMKKLH